MNLIELFLVFACVASAFVGSVWAGGAFGWIGYLVGAVGGILIVPTLLWLLGLFCVMVWGDFPPACESGQCEGTYRGELAGDEVDEVCGGCGRRYRRLGRRFMRVGADGQLQPYLIWKPFRGWFPDAGDKS